MVGNMNRRTKQPQELNTECEVSEYEGHPVIKIYELRPDGQKRDFPLITLGLRKAKAIVKHIEDVEAFSEGN